MTVAIIELLKGFINIFLEGTEPVKLDLVPELSKPEIRNVEQ